MPAAQTLFFFQILVAHIDLPIIARGRFTPKQLETAICQYAREYTRCKACRSFNTYLRRSGCAKEIVCTVCDRHTLVSKLDVKRNVTVKYVTCKKEKLR